MPRPGIDDAHLQANLDYACSQGIDCSPIQPGGACFEPATVVSHAAYAMNLLYQSAGRNPWNCDFLQTASVSATNPSKLPSSLSSSMPLVSYCLTQVFAFFIMIIVPSIAGYGSCFYPGGST